MSTINQAINRLAASFPAQVKKITELENSADLDDALKAATDSIAGTFRAIGSFKCKTPNDLFYIRLVLKNLFHVLCQPLDEPIHLDYSFPHKFAEIFNCVNVQTGWGWPCEIEDYFEIMDAFTYGQNPQWVARQIAEAIYKKVFAIIV